MKSTASEPGLKKKNNNSEYLNRIKYPSVYKDTVVSGVLLYLLQRSGQESVDLNMKVRINRVFGYEKGQRRVFKSIPSRSLNLPGNE